MRTPCPAFRRRSPHPSPSRRRRAVGGFTLLEILVALSILLILLLIGWSNFHDTLPRYRMVGAARLLRGNLMTLRNLAIQTNRETRLRLVSSPGCDDVDAWGGRWELAIGDAASRSASWDVLPEDSEADGSDDDDSEGRVDLGSGGNHQARGVCLEDWGTLEGPGPDTADSIVFSPRGWVANPGGDFSSDGTIDLVLVNQEAARKGVDDAIAVRVTRAGMVRLEPTLAGATPLDAATTSSSTAP